MFVRWFQKLPPSAREVALTCICGVAGSLAAVAFHEAITAIYEAVWEPLAETPLWQFAAVSLALLTGVGVVSGILMACIAPDAAGSGIPQLKVAYWRDMGCVPLKAVIVKFLAGVISVGGGLSLGREGPTVHIAGGLASWLSARLGSIGPARRTACACGAAAGLAAAFNTPIAAVTFVLEEIVEDLNSRSIGRILFASVVSVFALYLIAGTDAVFHIPEIREFDPVVYLLALPVGAVSALVGVAFQKATLGWRKRIRRRSKLPLWLRPAVGGFFTWIAGCAVFAFFGRTGIMGLGYEDLAMGLSGQLAFGVVAALLVAKFGATVASYAWGGCGGIFAPTLFLGAMAGCFCAHASGLLLTLDTGDTALLAVVGMSACLGAVVRAPLTSVLIVFEMTHDFALVVPLMIAAGVSQILSRCLCRDNFYSQVLRDDGIELDKLVGVRDFADWRKRRLGAFATFGPVAVESEDPSHLRELLEKYPYAVFPVTGPDGRVRGVASRDDIARASGGHAALHIHPAAMVSPEALIGQIERTLIDAPLNMLVLVDPARRNLVGIFTLHDLLRSQLAASDA